MNYYNENNPQAAQWLRNLIARGLIPDGYVDSRDIRDVRHGDLAGYTQCHFFAGIGGWSRALELAEWPASRPVWTGSCPCQPYSVAGKGQGEKDDRDLWPVWFDLIRQRRPTVVFGEQVANAIGHGWLDRTAANMEAENYAIGAAVLPACATVNAPHRRERLWFVAHANGNGRPTWNEASAPLGYRHSSVADGWASDAQLADTNVARLPRSAHRAENVGAEQREAAERDGPHGNFWSGAEYRQCADGKTRRVKRGVCLLVDGVPADVATSLAGYGNAIVPQVAAAFIAASVSQ